MLPLIIISGSTGGLLESSRSNRGYMAYWVHNVKRFVVVFITKHSRNASLIPSDATAVASLRGGYGVTAPTDTLKAALIYNFSSAGNYKDVSFVLTSGTSYSSWSGGLKCFSWHEREIIEMSGTAITDVKDSRSLLLDYGHSNRPSAAKNKLPIDGTVYYSCYSNSIRISGGTRPTI